MEKLKKNIKKNIRAAMDITLLFYGILNFFVRKKNNEKYYLAMIRLHCFSGGKTTDLANRVVGLLSKKQPIKNIDLQPIFLPPKSSQETQKIIHALNKEGCYIFSEKFPDEMVEHFVQMALKEPCRVEDLHQILPDPLVFDPKHPKAARYSIPTEVLLNDSLMQAMILDKTLIDIATQYLQNTPKLDICTVWWSTAWAKEPSTQAAQMYHFDMDRIKWLKLFIYLVDVDETNGPHVFVKKTHQYDKRQNHLLTGGYVRLADEAVESVFSDQVTHITGPKGTMFLADTRAFHKGLLPEAGNRLVLQLEFTSCLFGAAFSAIPNTIQIKSPILKQLLLQQPDLMPLIQSWESL